ncbi:MAG: hypothetical protein CM1200mP10_23850 [Candidatus Neomarinimicrobiota bacterium]|nr:MAG: hypothetical protein CM1200mP10_23850 [Candidatus Neomarinimicrobiota bacterium]
MITEEFFEKYSSFFDIIINSHVLEHVETPKNFLLDIRGMLKDGGTFVIAIPQGKKSGVTSLFRKYFIFFSD